MLSTLAIEPPEADAPQALTLEIRDTALLADLAAQAPVGRAREELALTAMRIGLLALAQARGQIDAERVRNEGDRIVADLGHALARHREQVTGEIAQSLKEYFDPKSGRFAERVERLVARDGELEQIVHRLVGAGDSELAKTLRAHVGEGSQLLALLDPQGADGLAASLAASVEAAARESRETILKEFTLDNKSGALARLVAELGARHGEIGEALAKQIETVVGEFDLAKEDSALSHLVRRVEHAQKQISSEFSLDQEGSALARMQRQLLKVMSDQSEKSERFQREVTEALAAMTTRRAEALRSTLHGHDFEAALGERLQALAAGAGDICTPVGLVTGIIRNCKTGDYVVEIGPDQHAAGARIVVEAKESAGVTLKGALEEIDEARRNRAAGVGLFVFSARTAPAGLPPLKRFGEDILVVWSSEDPSSDVILHAGLAAAKAIAAKAAHGAAEAKADFDAIEKAIREIEKQAEQLEEIDRSATTIRNSADKILDRVRITRTSLEKQVKSLDTHVIDLRTLTSE